MILDEKEVKLPRYTGQESILEYFAGNITKRLSPNEFPVRFAVTCTDEHGLLGSNPTLSKDEVAEIY